MGVILDRLGVVLLGKGDHAERVVDNRDGLLHLRGVSRAPDGFLGSLGTFFLALLTLFGLFLFLLGLDLLTLLFLFFGDGRLVLEYASRDFLGALNGLSTDQLCGFGQTEVEVDGLQAVAVQSQHRTQMAHGLIVERLLLPFTRGPGLLTHDLRQIDAREDRADQRIGQHGLVEHRFGIGFIAALPGQIT